MLFLDSLLGAIAYDAEVPQRHRLWRRDTCYADTIGRRGADVAPSSAPQILAPSSVVTTWLGYMSRESRTGTGGATRWIGCARVRSVQQPGASAEQAENSKWRAASGLEQSGCNRWQYLLYCSTANEQSRRCNRVCLNCSCTWLVAFIPVQTIKIYVDTVTRLVHKERSKFKESCWNSASNHYL
jgi:hypothetical protein